MSQLPYLLQAALVPNHTLDPHLSRTHHAASWKRPLKLDSSPRPGGTLHQQPTCLVLFLGSRAWRLRASPSLTSSRPDLQPWVPTAHHPFLCPHHRRTLSSITLCWMTALPATALHAEYPPHGGPEMGHLGQTLSPPCLTGRISSPPWDMPLPTLLAPPARSVILPHVARPHPVSVDEPHKLFLPCCCCYDSFLTCLSHTFSHRGLLVTMHVSARRAPPLCVTLSPSCAALRAHRSVRQQSRGCGGPRLVSKYHPVSICTLHSAQPWKGRRFHHRPCQGCTWRTVCQQKHARHKKTNTVWLQSYEGPRGVRSGDTGERGAPGAGG